MDSHTGSAAQLRLGWCARQRQQFTIVLFLCVSCYCRKGKGSGQGITTQVALVVLLVLAGGLSLMQLSSRSQVRDLRIHHEALQEELTYTKNHLHHVEVRWRAYWGGAAKSDLWVCWGAALQP